MCFAPRWVRGSLLVDPLSPECLLQIVSLPLASHMLLKPHADDFASALAQHGDGDVRATLTDLMNRFPAVTAGATLSLRLDDTSHMVDVVAVRGLRQVRCGAPGVVGPRSESAPPPSDDASEPTPAVCLVDADVNVDFAPSVASEIASER